MALVAGPAARPPRRGGPATAVSASGGGALRAEGDLSARSCTPPCRELVGAEVTDQHAELLVPPSPGLPLGSQLFPEGGDRGAALPHVA